MKLGFMSAFVKASAAALRDQPVVNAGIVNKASLLFFLKEQLKLNPHF